MSDTSPLWVTAVSGSVAGLAQDLLLHPVDTIRARLQVKSSGPTSPLRAFVEVARDTVRGPAGIRGLYRGFTSVMLFCVPTNAVYFGGYSFWRQRLLQWYGGGSKRGGSSADLDLSLAERGLIDLGAGFGAELMSASLWTPYDVIKQQLQVSDGTSSSAGGAPTADHRRLVNLCRDIYARDGVPGFFRGIFTGVAVWGPYSAIFFSSYEAFKRGIVSPGDGDSGGNSGGGGGGRASIVEWRELLCGVCAGGVAAVATQPLDCVKTRLQTQGSGAAGVGVAPPGKRLGAGGIFLQTVRREGAGALFRGTLGRVLWLAPGSGLTIFVFEATCAAIGR